jgi:hypothetical protein
MSAATLTPRSPLWSRLYALIDGVEADQARAHDLGPLTAARWRSIGREVPPSLVREERAARLAARVVPRILEQARAAYDGRVLIFKGPEVAARYPGSARFYSDLDLLVADAEVMRRRLLAAGFVAVEDPPDADAGDHHLPPVVLPGLPLQLELHTKPKWPRKLAQPATAELFESAVPAGVPVDGLEAPAPHHHALLLAVHAWSHGALRSARDLLDVAILAEESDREQIATVADAWGIGRLWETTIGAADWLFGGEDGRPPMAVRLWARHLLTLRDATVAENHLERWVSSFWMLPPRAAATRAVSEMARDFRRRQRERRRDKLARMVRAIRNSFTKKSDYGWKR